MMAPETIIAARKQAGLSQSGFAALLRISKRTLQEWEQGRRNPSGLYLERLEQVITQLNQAAPTATDSGDAPARP